MKYSDGYKNICMCDGSLKDKVESASQKKKSNRKKFARPDYSHFLTSRFADHSVGQSHFMETYLVDNAMLAVMETASPYDWRQKRWWKSPGSNHPPFSMYYFNKSTY